MFKRRHFEVYGSNMPQNIHDGSNKAGEAGGAKKKQLEKHVVQIRLIGSRSAA